jgi:hypothetical protein
MKIKPNDNLNLEDLLVGLGNKKQDEKKSNSEVSKDSDSKQKRLDEDKAKILDQERREKAKAAQEQRIRNEQRSQGTSSQNKPTNKVQNTRPQNTPAPARKEEPVPNSTANKIKQVVQKEKENIKENINKRLSNKVPVNYDVDDTDKERINLDKIGELNSNTEYDRAKLKAAGILVTASFEFAKAQYQRTFALLILIVIITVTVVFQTYNIATYKAPVKYIPVYEDKTIIDPLPLNKPVMSDDAMKQWLADSVSDIFSYTYLNVDKHGEKISPYFTEQGYKKFQKEFLVSADVNRVRGQSLIVVSNVVGSPTKMFDGYKVSGPYAYWDWHFQLRQVFISTNNKYIPVTYDVVATVIRQDQRTYRNGVAIHNLRIVSSSELKAAQQN